MKIGILACDDVPERIRDQFPDYPEMFRQSFSEAGCNYKFQTYRVTEEELPADLHGCDAYITTGSRAGANDEEPWIRKLEQFVLACRYQQKKLVGVCFGHQVLARALGGRVARNDAGWGVGMIQSSLVSRKPWIKPAVERFGMIISHQDHVEQLPENSVLLASNDHCRNFIVQFDNHLLGIQGHPEFSSEYSHALMTVNNEIIPAEILEKGYQSLSGKLDSKQVMQWISRFFTATG